jgi:SAM-dependent methyltransferase
MPSIEDNIGMWNGRYAWKGEGDEWSHPWGSSEAQWFRCIYPRIQKFLPASATLELAPGFGRWTEFLLPHCETYIGIDLATRCVEACNDRFANHPDATFYVNDGSTIPMVADSSIDFAFTFDSFVHVEADTLLSYLKELNRVLKTDGVAFVHHSNYGAYQRSAAVLAPLQLRRRLPSKVSNGLDRIAVTANVRWRASSVSAERFVDLCEESGLHCVGQELVNWGGSLSLIDAMSLVTRPGSAWDRPNQVIKNRLFGLEARAIRRSSSVMG